MTLVELYKKNRNIDIQNIIKNNNYPDALRKDLCNELGFCAQLVNNDIIDKLYPRMDELHYFTLRIFLPKTYKENEWKNYKFDIIPIPILEEIQFVKQLQIFDKLEIWTPEKIQIPDPIVVGIKSEIIYIIGRWGESLLPFNDILDIVIKRKLFSRSLISSQIFDVIKSKCIQNPEFLLHDSFHIRKYMLFRDIFPFVNTHCNTKYSYIIPDWSTTFIKVCSKCGFIAGEYRKSLG